MRDVMMRGRVRDVMRGVGERCNDEGGGWRCDEGERCDEGGGGG